MGAYSFSATAFGKTPRDAFSAAVERAQHEHGHGGYTGTIAEKHSFVQMDLPKGVTLAKFLMLLDEAEQYGYLEWEREQLQEHARRGVGARKKWGGKTLKQAQAQFEREQRKADRFWNRLSKTPGLTEAVKKAERLYHDKWGPALCFGPITGKQMRDQMHYAVGVKQEHKDGRWQYSKPRGQDLYLFCGLASS
jgi:hypothetical protein